MAVWINRTELSGSSIDPNGTTSHTCSFTAATAGNFLVAIIAGSVTSTTPSGWTLLVSAVNYTGLYVFTKTADSAEASFTTTHNGSNYPIKGVVYEFPAGTSTASSSINNIASITNPITGPTVTSLTGTYTRFTARSNSMTTSTSAASLTWTIPSVEDTDSYIARSGSIDGVHLSIAYDNGQSTTSFTPAYAISGTNLPSSGEAIAFGLYVASPNNTPPTLAATYATDYITNIVGSKTISVTTQAGDLVVVTAAMENGSDAIIAPTGNSINFIQRQLSGAAIDYSPVGIWTGVDTVGGTNWTLSIGRSNSAGRFGATVYIFRNYGYVGASNATTLNGGAPTLSLTPTNSNSALVVVSADWNAVDGSSRTWNTINSITPTSGNGLEKNYAYVSGNYTAYGAYYTNIGTTDSKTIGLSAPTGQKYSIAAIEIVGTPALDALTALPWTI
jgi:hypothetical protein